MVEFWMMIVMASSSNTVVGIGIGQGASPPVYYTRELCETAAKEIEAKNGSQHMCMSVRPVINTQTIGVQ